MYFKASLGLSVIMITGVTTLFMGAVSYFIYLSIITRPDSNIGQLIVPAIAILLSLGSLVFAYIFSPSGYTIDNAAIVIVRPYKNILIPFEEVKDAFLVKKGAINWFNMVRVGGNGGVFGFYGRFKGPFGMMTLYATRLDNYLLVETIDSDRILITPDDKTMVSEIRKRIAKYSEV